MKIVVIEPLGVEKEQLLSIAEENFPSPQSWCVTIPE